MRNWHFDKQKHYLGYNHNIIDDALKIKLRQGQTDIAHCMMG